MSGLSRLSRLMRVLTSCRFEPPPPLSQIVQFSVNRHAHWMNSRSLPLPRDDVVLVDAVHRSDELHSLKVFAPELRDHPLQLRAVEHRHDRCLDHVAEMVPERDLVAAELLRLRVEVPPPHLRAEVARRFLLLVRNVENVRLENGDRNVEKLRVRFDLLPVDRVVAGIHHEIHEVERDFAVPLQHLHELRHQHGVLAAGDADCYLVPRFDELIPLHRRDKGIPDLLPEFFGNAPLNELIGFEFSFHRASSL